MDFMQDVLIVTIGNYGIGYAQIGGDNLLQNLQTVNLKDEPSIQSQSLDDSSYKTVKVLSVSQDIIKLLLTTTSSLHFVVNFKLANNILSFAGVTESYYRYGTLQLLSWASMTKDSFFASYYNPSRKQVQLVRYPRVEGKATYFHDSIGLAAMITQQAAILSGNTLFASAFG